MTAKKRKPQEGDFLKINSDILFYTGKVLVSRNGQKWTITEGQEFKTWDEFFDLYGYTFAQEDEVERFLYDIEFAGYKIIDGRLIKMAKPIRSDKSPKETEKDNEPVGTEVAFSYKDELVYLWGLLNDIEDMATLCLNQDKTNNFKFAKIIEKAGLRFKNIRSDGHNLFCLENYKLTDNPDNIYPYKKS